MVGVVLLQLAIVAVLGVVEVVGKAISAIVPEKAPGKHHPLVGCRSTEPQDVMGEPEAARQAIGKVHLGDSEETVLSILSVPKNSPQSRYSYILERNELIRIYYLRTNWMPDDCLTEDELTPFIFRDGVLVSIGWRTLSGPHSFGTPHIDNSQGNSDSVPR